MTAPAPALLRLLFTSSREIDHRYPVVRALSDTVFRLRAAPGNAARPVTLIHGAAKGGDEIADQVWATWAAQWPDVYLMPPERHPAKDHADPKVRNAHMVELGADACAAVAKQWASGTGHCARLARAAGIPVWDFDVDTAPRKRAAR